MEIKATSKEIADLILALQGQHRENVPVEIMSGVVSQSIYDIKVHLKGTKKEAKRGIKNGITSNTKIWDAFYWHGE